MSDRFNRTRKLSAKKAKHRRCYFKLNKASGAGTGGGDDGGGCSGNNIAMMPKNQMQQFCIDSNNMVDTARKYSLSGKKKPKLKISER